MIPYWMGRTQMLLGEEKVDALMKKHVLVVGLGGVGGICAEMIARSGVGKMTIVDGDVVDLSNCNRQIPALHSTAGRKKAEVMAERIKDINPDIGLTVIAAFEEKEDMGGLVTSDKFDYAVDCIDTLGPKVHLMKACLDNNVPVVSSMGAGGRIDPSWIEVVDIDETRECTLAKYVRKRLHEMGIYKGITVVYSREQIDESKVIVSDKAYPKKSLIGTISYMPAIFGCTVASVVIRNLMNS